MKMALLKNYWLIIMAWSFYLNGHVLIASVLTLVSCGFTLYVRSEVDLWRVSAISLAIYSISLIVLINSNIPYFFPGLKYFLILTSLSCGLSNEYLYVIKKRFILPVLITIFIYLGGLFTVIYLLPEESYTMFTKGSICLMALFIFLPYLVTMAYACLFQCKAVLSKNGGLSSLR